MIFDCNSPHVFICMPFHDRRAYIFLATVCLPTARNPHRIFDTLKIGNCILMEYSTLLFQHSIWFSGHYSGRWINIRRINRVSSRLEIYIRNLGHLNLPKQAYYICFFTSAFSLRSKQTKNTFSQLYRYLSNIKMWIKMAVQTIRSIRITM